MNVSLKISFSLFLSQMYVFRVIQIVFLLFLTSQFLKPTVRHKQQKCKIKQWGIYKQKTNKERITIRSYVMVSWCTYFTFCNIHKFFKRMLGHMPLQLKFAMHFNYPFDKKYIHKLFPDFKNKEWQPGPNYHISKQGNSLGHLAE